MSGAPNSSETNINEIVIGKRVQLGAAITSTAVAIADFYPEYATAIVSAAIPITFTAQVAWAHFRGITTASKD